MNQAYVVCLPTQASSHPLARGRALLGRACQEQFFAPARQPPVSACLYQNTECAALHWLGCMVNALHRNDPPTMTICCSETYRWLYCMHRLSCIIQGLNCISSVACTVLYPVCALFYNVHLPVAAVGVDYAAPGVGK